MDFLHLVCSACQAVNRIQAERLTQQPRCGQCKQPLFSGHPIELTEVNFKSQLTRSDIPLVVDFWAPWCGPCQMMAPAFVKAAQKLEPEVRLAKLNTEQEPELAGQFQIRSIPTMIMFKAGREISRVSGAMQEADIVRWVRAQL